MSVGIGRLLVRLKKTVDGTYVRVAPDQVAYTIRQHDVRAVLGTFRRGVFAGDWDLLKQPFEETLLYEAFRQRFVHGEAWSQTRYYSKAHEMYGRVEELGGTEAYFAYCDDLFRKIEKDGYDNGLLISPMKVHIARDGSLIRHNGSHRLAAARILSVPAIKVEPYLIHADAAASRRPIAGR